MRMSMDVHVRPPAASAKLQRNCNGTATESRLGACSAVALLVGYSSDVAKDGHHWRSTFMSLKINFSDYFDVDPELLDAFGALNVSLINDLPLFIDPFLLFNSQNEEYQRLHAEIVRYVRYLREIATKEKI